MSDGFSFSRRSLLKRSISRTVTLFRQWVAEIWSVYFGSNRIDWIDGHMVKSWNETWRIKVVSSASIGLLVISMLPERFLTVRHRHITFVLLARCNGRLKSYALSLCCMCNTCSIRLEHLRTVAGIDSLSLYLSPYRSLVHFPFRFAFRCTEYITVIFDIVKLLPLFGSHQQLQCVTVTFLFFNAYMTW